MPKPEEISRYINQLSFDLKAEMLVAVLLEQKSEFPEISAVFEGQHKRAWSKDVDSATVGDQGIEDGVLFLHLNRDGIYDLLPEGVFHGIQPDDTRSGEEMARESMKLRAEEKEARLFFQPFENEIFRSGVQLSMMENHIFRNVYKELLTGIIPQFWKIREDLCEEHVTRLKKLLPFAYRVCGDMNLTVQCLEYLLNEKVRMKVIDYTGYETASSGITGKNILGNDLVLGSNASGSVGSFKFLIGPVTSHENIKLIENGSMDRFLECFYGYFIPFELDVDSEYIFSDEDGMLILAGEEGKFSCLAYNSVLQ